MFLENMKPEVEEVVIASFLASISVVFQIFHPFTGVNTGWMWIDVVAVPWLVAFFMRGFKTALLTACLSSFVISLVAPSGFVGATMKFIATFPMLFVPALVATAFKKNVRDLPVQRLRLFAVFSLPLALIVRCALVLPFNYYFAIPVFFGMSTEEAVKFVPPLVMAGFNSIQGTLEFSVAFLVCFSTRLRRFRWH